MSRRAVITGVGTVAPGAIGTKEYWDLLAAGRTATRRISLFDPARYRSQIAAECDFDTRAQGPTPQESRRLDRAAQFALVAAREAMTDSGLEFERIDPSRTGVAFGSAVGCTTTLEREYIVSSDGGSKWEVDPEYTWPHLYDAFAPSSIAAELALVAGAEGPVGIVSTGCTSGLDAVGYAADLVIDGSGDILGSGGGDATLSALH